MFLEQGNRIQLDVIFPNHLFFFSSQHGSFDYEKIHILYISTQCFEKPLSQIAMAAEVSGVENGFPFRFDFEHISIESRMGNIIRSNPNLSFDINGDIRRIRVETINGNQFFTIILMLVQCIIFTLHHFLCSLANVLRDVFGHKGEQSHMITMIMGIKYGVCIVRKSGYIGRIQFFFLTIGQIGTQVDEYFGVAAFDFGDASSYLVCTAVDSYFHKVVEL